MMAVDDNLLNVVDASQDRKERLDDAISQNAIIEKQIQDLQAIIEGGGLITRETSKLGGSADYVSTLQLQNQKLEAALIQEEEEDQMKSAKIQKLEQELAEIKARYSALQINSSRFEELKVELEQTVQSLKDELNEVKEQNVELNKRIEEELKLEEEAADNLLGLQREQRNAEMDIASLQKTVQELEQENKKNKKKMRAYSDSIKALKKQQAENEAKIQKQNIFIETLK